MRKKIQPFIRGILFLSINIMHWISFNVDETVWHLINEVRLVPYIFYKRKILELGPRDRLEKGMRGEGWNEAGERMKPAVVAVKCARGASSGVYPHRLVSVGVDVARLSPGPERVAWPSPFRTPPVPLSGGPSLSLPLSFSFSPFQLLAVSPREMVPTISRA